MVLLLLPNADLFICMWHFSLVKAVICPVSGDEPHAYVPAGATLGPGMFT